MKAVKEVRNREFPPIEAGLPQAYQASWKARAFESVLARTHSRALRWA